MQQRIDNAIATLAAPKSSTSSDIEQWLQTHFANTPSDRELALAILLKHGANVGGNIYGLGQIVFHLPPLAPMPPPLDEIVSVNLERPKAKWILDFQAIPLTDCARARPGLSQVLCAMAHAKEAKVTIGQLMGAAQGIAKWGPVSRTLAEHRPGGKPALTLADRQAMAPILESAALLLQYPSCPGWLEVDWQEGVMQAVAKGYAQKQS